MNRVDGVTSEAAILVGVLLGARRFHGPPLEELEGLACTAGTRVVGHLTQRRETAEWVQQMIAQLPESYRNVIVLRDIEELDTVETARLLGMTPGAVKTRLHRARLFLRGKLSVHLGYSAA